MWVGDEGPCSVDRFGDHLADRQREPGAEHSRDGCAAPGGMARAVSEEEDDGERGDEKSLGDVDIEEEGVLDDVVAEEIVVERVQHVPVHA